MDYFNQISKRTCLGVTAVAIMLGCSTQYISKAARSGELEGDRVFNTYRFSIDAVLDFMERHATR